MNTATVIPSKKPNAASPPFTLSDGSLEALKWLAMIVMTLDHINKYIYNEKLVGIFELGRVAMPIFAFVLAYNLARPNAFESGLYIRVMKRLAFFGALAVPACVAMMGFKSFGLPLNIMFLLLVATGTLYLAQRPDPKSSWYAITLFIVGGTLAEYWWFGLIVILASFVFIKRPSVVNYLILAFGVSLLLLINVNLWALGALPIIYIAHRIDFKVPRIKNIFYVYYPAHLTAIALFIHFSRQA